jgi:acyl-CoA synthetase (AMP-forming)/AMP-acid ligase II
MQEYITLFHACLRNATTTAQISPYSTPFELNHALTVAHPTRLFIDAKLLDRMLPVCKKAGIADDNIYILKSPRNEMEFKGRRSCLGIIEYVKRKSIKIVPVGIAAKDTVAYLVFSSGTTGLPKGDCHPIKPFLLLIQLL